MSTQSSKAALKGRAQLHGAKSQVRGKYGAEALALVGLDVRLARKPMALVEQARHVRGRLSDPELGLPAPGPGVQPLDPAQLAAELISDTEALATALANLRAAQVRGKETLLERRRALAPLHVRYLGMGGGVPPCHKGGSRGVQRYLSITGPLVHRPEHVTPA